MKITKNSQTIATLEDWEKHAAPKGKDKHWKTGRSAKECAVAWCGTDNVPTVPEEIRSLLGSHEDIKNCVIDEVLPEHSVRFDKLPGEPRNSDVCCKAHDDFGNLAISIEAKADEPFGSLVSHEMQRIVDIIANDKNTNGIKRIQQLAQSLLPEWKAESAHLGELRYQLLTGVAGAIAYAEDIGSTRAVFIIHEFITDETLDNKHSSNSKDLDCFINRFSEGITTKVPTAKLCGPILIPGKPLFDSLIKVYVGKVTRNIRS